MNTELKRNRLVESIRLLAADAATQLSLFPSDVCKVDELALVFEDCVQFLPELLREGMVTPESASIIAELDNMLDRLSDGGLSYWSESALENSPKWAEIRKMALCALASLRKPYSVPRIDWLTFVTRKTAEGT